MLEYTICGQNIQNSGSEAQLMNGYCLFSRKSFLIQHSDDSAIIGIDVAFLYNSEIVEYFLEFVGNFVSKI